MMEWVMSLADIAAVKVAVGIWNNPELKNELLSAFGYDFMNFGYEMNCDREARRNRMREKKVTNLLSHLGLPKELREHVMVFVGPIKERILCWAHYHKLTVGFSLEYSIHFLNSSFFTQLGVIDNRKVAGGLMNDKNLSIEQKYKFATRHCLTDYMSVLRTQMTPKDEKNVSSITGQCIDRLCVECREFGYEMVKADELVHKCTLGTSVECRLDLAVENGSKTAVEYWLDKTRGEGAVVRIAIKTLDWITENDEHDLGIPYWKLQVPRSPRDYYLDILVFLLSKMKNDQRIRLLWEKIDFSRGDRTLQSLGPSVENDRCCPKLLNYILDWPYQGYFMKMAGLAFEILPRSDFADVLLMICDKIESVQGFWGDEKRYEYKRILMEFWNQGPEQHKSYVLSNPKVTPNCAGKGEELLIALLSLNKLTRDDGRNIELIFCSATEEQIQSIITSEEWGNRCVASIQAGDWKRLNRFTLSYFSNKARADKFKKEFIFSKKAQQAIVWLAQAGKWNILDSFIKWCSLPEKELNRFKREVIHSEAGMDYCLDQFSIRAFEGADNFMKWCFVSEGEVKAFRKNLILSVLKDSEECKNMRERQKNKHINDAALYFEFYE